MLKNKIYYLLHVYKDSLKHVKDYNLLIKAKPKNVEIVFENEPTTTFDDYLEFIKQIDGNMCIDTAHLWS